MQPLEVANRAVLGFGQPIALQHRSHGLPGSSFRTESPRPKSLGLWLLLLLWLSGCSAVAVRPPEWPQQTTYEAQLVDRYANGIPPAAYTDAAERNRVVNDMLFLCNVIYRQWEADLYSSGALFNTAGDLLMLGLSSAGAVAGGGTAQVLSGVLAGVAGSRTAIDKNLFQEQSRIALLTKMEAMRLSKLAEIQDLQQEPIDVWPLSAAMLDVQAYYEAGTLMAAFRSLTQQAGSDLAAARARMAR